MHETDDDRYLLDFHNINIIMSVDSANYKINRKNRTKREKSILIKDILFKKLQNKLF